MIKYSIIIPNYNSLKWIKRCLDSVLQQTYTNFELIIVDDISDDGSLDVIKESQDERIKLIENKVKKYNGGSRNVGIDNATGDYILFLDDDDYISDKTVLHNLTKFIENNNVDLIRLSYIANKGRRLSRISISEYDLRALANTIFVAPWTKCIKREKIVKFPENTLLEDVVQHIEQIDNIDSFANSNVYYAVWNRNNEDAISSDTRQYDKNSKRYSSVYRNLADLLDLKCKHDYCEEQRQFRIRNYEDIIQKGDILGLINGVDKR